ncbi:MAG: phosphate ABC transporter permease PstA [Planctomycetota bacterium]|nr:MAG: phosphate ABC transporter permease PstA [Planctomycetota bacterium]
MSSERPRQRRRRSAHATLAAHGEPWVWITAGSLALTIVMIVGLLAFIAVRGAATFWPVPLELVHLADGRRVLGEVTQREAGMAPRGEVAGRPARRLLRSGDFAATGTHSEWIDDSAIADTSRPEWATVVERMEGGRLHGFPRRLLHGAEVVAEGPAATWEAFCREHPAARRRLHEVRHIDKVERGTLQRELRAARLAVVRAGLDSGAGSPQEAAAAESAGQVVARVTAEEKKLDERTAALRERNAGWGIEFETASGAVTAVPMDAVVRGWQPNRLSVAGRLGVYASRWAEFLADDPREANSAGGVFPAIWGTVVMTLMMALLVAPFGVLAALYLREYASRGPVTTAVRVAINNLAGVPSIVYGAFGLGFFCYGLGAGIDELFFKASLVADGQPTFGTGGLLWASLTLALLTLPVVIVATEEALSAVPNSMREGSYACGAGKWQTIRRIVLPRALPGIMTGLILAMARGAGEVAPLMLVGVKKLALDLPVDGTFPFVHPEREFMHLAYLIYDVGFQSPDSQAARPMVFTITFLLVAIIALLNVAAIWVRSRLRRRYVSQQF